MMGNKEGSSEEHTSMQPTQQLLKTPAVQQLLKKPACDPLILSKTQAYYFQSFYQSFYRKLSPQHSFQTPISSKPPHSLETSPLMSENDRNCGSRGEINKHLVLF